MNGCLTLTFPGSGVDMRNPRMSEFLDASAVLMNALQDSGHTVLFEDGLYFVEHDETGFTRVYQTLADIAEDMKQDSAIPFWKFM